MDELQNAFTALLPRINAIAAAQHRRSWAPGRPTLADTRQQAALIMWRKMTEGAVADPINSLSRDLHDWFRHETHYRSQATVATTETLPVTVTRFTPLDFVAAADLTAAVHSRVAALPAPQRYAIRERAAGAKIRAIATGLGLTPSRVSQLLSKARATLAEVAR